MFAEAQKWLCMMTSSVANETVKHYRVTINKAGEFRLGQSFYS